MPEDIEIWSHRYGPERKATRRIVVFPHAGGSATYFRDFALMFPETIEVVPLQYPGRQERFSDEPMTEVASLAEAVAAIAPAWSELPLTFFGHSLGALVAFETARLLERSGMRLAGLIASARAAPTVGSRTDVHRKSASEIIDLIRGLGGTDERILALPDLIVPIIRADFEAAETYRYRHGPALGCAIAAFGGESDGQVAIGDLALWKHHTSASFSLRTFAGGHFYFQDDMRSVVQAVLEQVDAPDSLGHPETGADGISG